MSTIIPDIPNEYLNVDYLRKNQRRLDFLAQLRAYHFKKNTSGPFSIERSAVIQFDVLYKDEMQRLSLEIEFLLDYLN